MKKLLLFFAAVGACLSGVAQLNQIVAEPYSMTVGTQPAGTTTYRLYAEMAQATDKVSAVFATLGCHPLNVSTTTTFHNDGFGGTLGSTINAGFFGFFPTYEADSWVTIGASNTASPGAADVGAVATVPAAPYAPSVGTTPGVSLVMEDGAWYTLATSASALPTGPNNRVLLGQFTTDGDFTYSINLQVFVGGDQANGREDYVNSVDCIGSPITAPTGFEVACPSCTFPAIITDVLGCTDPAACNYDVLATLDDGTCEFVSCAGCTDAGACNYDAAATIDDGSCDFVSCAGCTDVNAINYDATATIDDASCIVPTCAPTVADNYTYCYDSGVATFTYVGANLGDQVILVINAGTFETCCDELNIYDGPNTSGALIFSGTGDVSGVVAVSTSGALTIEVFGDVSIDCVSGSETGLDYDIYCGILDNPGCTDAGACNYDATATSDNGSCVFPAANDLSSGAIAISGAGTITIDNTAACQNEGLNGSCHFLGDAEQSSIWYTFTTTADAEISFETVNPVGWTDTQFVVYDAAFNEVACDDDNGGGLLSLLNFACGDLAAGTYYLQVDGYNGQVGQVDLNYSISELACQFVLGCTDVNAVNYNAAATLDDGTCIVPSCAPTTPDNYTYCYGNSESTLISYVAAPGEQVTIFFNSGALESCCDDLNIYDGIGNGGALLTTVTGDISGLAVTSTTGAITLEIISDNTVSCASGSVCCSAGFDYDVYCGTLAVLGCTDPAATNYDAAATVDDGSCIFCNDNLVEVTVVNGSFPGEMGWEMFDGGGVSIASGDGFSADFALCLVSGCYSFDISDTFGDGWNGGSLEISVNGSAFASLTVLNADDLNVLTVYLDFGASGLCPVLGCTDPTACNYDAAATLDDGSCVAGPCINELPELAYALPVNGLGVCAGLSGDVNEATIASPEATYRTSALDLWYSFVATTSGVRIEMTGADFDALIELQDASNNPVDIEDVSFTGDNEVLNIGNLTAGDTYLVRVAPYFSTSGPAPFDICVQAIPDTRCDYGSGPYSLCNLFKADWVSSDDYIFHFTSQTSGITYDYQSGGANTFVVLSNVAGLGWDDTYDVSIDAVWNLADGNGTSEDIAVLGDEPCSIIVNPVPATQLRASDNQANFGPHFLGGYVAATPFVCGVVDWTWTFTNVDGSQLPITHLRGSSNRFIQLNTIPGLVPGAVYSVTVKPEFANGAVTLPGVAELLSIIGPVNMEGTIASPVVIEEGAERLDVTDVTAAALYPNPNNGELVYINVNNIAADVDRITVDIFNGMGSLVMSEQIAVSGANMQNVLSLNGLASGVYTVKINVGSDVQTERLVIQK
ncbi:MAG: T9SS type A sorting domain-containing protein [Flavobacteriales bacterium]|nr:T9SS type A sorting domain-containing protein [Flavobacteriales bacterium]